MDNLHLISAGAGAGKTYEICATISSAIISDEMMGKGTHPARILATTFTKKAAAELKGRLQKSLLSDKSFVNSKDRQKKAEDLELALIGTVHSVGHQLLSRYALNLGLSPHLQVLEDEGSTRCLQDLLAGMDMVKLEELTVRAKKLSIDNPQSLVMNLLAHKRSNLISDEEISTQLRASLLRLLDIMAPDGTTPDAPSFEQVRSLVDTAIGDITALGDKADNTAKAVLKLEAISASEDPTWSEFLSANKLAAGKRSGADACLADLRAATAELLRHPELHADLQCFVEALIHHMHELEAEYTRYKTERGLLDFTDLEVLFLKLLRDEALLDTLSIEFQLVVVDEFQDSNPIQLAIFKRLQTLATQNCWVGDHKQAIFGFRGTDPELIRAVWDNVPLKARKSVKKNRRSGRGIVEFVNAVFTPVFGEDAAQEPHRSGEVCPIERWVFDTKNKTQDVQCLAAGIADLWQAGTPLRDIAILARTNDSLKAIGEALAALGIPALLELPGLFSTREGALVLSGLCLVADRRDSLAAATIMHLFEDPLSDTPEWLIERLRKRKEQRAEKAAVVEVADSSYTPEMPWHGHARLNRLEQIDVRTNSPSVIVQRVIDALDAGALIREWGEVARRAANLDAILQLAKSYEEAALARGSAATLYGLNSHLTELAEKEQDIRLAPHGLDAVTLLTYHRSKGLEWPVVVLTDLGEPRDPDLWSPVVSGGSPLSDDPLRDRTLRYWPWPFGRSQGFGKILTGSGLEKLVLQTPEGQEEETRSRQESLRLLYVGCTRACDRLVLAHRRGGSGWLSLANQFDELLLVDQEPGEYPLRETSANYRLRVFAAPQETASTPVDPRTERWLATLEGKTEEQPVFPQRYWSPSAEQTVGVPEITVHELSSQAEFPTKLPKDKEDALGNAFHAYLAALPSLVRSPQPRKSALALRILKAFSVEAHLPPESMVACGERFLQWVEATYPGARWVTEMPISAPREAGGQWSGTIDLMLLLPSGKAVIIDHKASPIRRAACVQKAVGYHGQLSAYAECVRSQSIEVEAVWLHFPLVGVVALTHSY